MLDGGIGADTMIGGEGNDTYFVDNPDDKIEEMLNEGIDTVEASVDHELFPNVENLTLTGNASINGTGNNLDNTLNGNSKANELYGGEGADTIDGGAGKDKLYGGPGNDSYIVDRSGDWVIEETDAGIDTVFSSADRQMQANVENLFLTGNKNIDGWGNSEDNWLVGNDGKNMLSGGWGNDSIVGGAGKDELIGGAGRDHFVFTQVSDSLPKGKRDMIEDFQQGSDLIDLSVIDADATTPDKDQDFDFIGESSFSSVPGELRYQVYGDGLILSGDVDGDAKADFEIYLSGVYALSEADLIL